MPQSRPGCSSRHSPKWYRDIVSACTANLIPSFTPRPDFVKPIQFSRLLIIYLGHARRLPPDSNPSPLSGKKVGSVTYKKQAHMAHRIGHEATKRCNALFGGQAHDQVTCIVRGQTGVEFLREPIVRQYLAECAAMHGPRGTSEVINREGRMSRRLRRSGGAPIRARSAVRLAPYRRSDNPFALLRNFRDDEVAHIHLAVLTVVEKIGIKALLLEVRRRFSAAGIILHFA